LRERITWPRYSGTDQARTMVASGPRRPWSAGSSGETRSAAWSFVGAGRSARRSRAARPAGWADRSSSLQDIAQGGQAAAHALARDERRAAQAGGDHVIGLLFHDAGADRLSLVGWELAEQLLHRPGREAVDALELLVVELESLRAELVAGPVL